MTSHNLHLTIRAPACQLHEAGAGREPDGTRKSIRLVTTSSGNSRGRQPFRSARGKEAAHVRTFACQTIPVLHRRKVAECITTVSCEWYTKSDARQHLQLGEKPYSRRGSQSICLLTTRAGIPATKAAASNLPVTTACESDNRFRARSSRPLKFARTYPIQTRPSMRTSAAGFSARLALAVQN